MRDSYIATVFLGLLVTACLLVTDNDRDKFTQSMTYQTALDNAELFDKCLEINPDYLRNKLGSEGLDLETYIPYDKVDLVECEGLEGYGI